MHRTGSALASGLALALASLVFTACAHEAAPAPPPTAPVAQVEVPPPAPPPPPAATATATAAPEGAAKASFGAPSKLDGDGVPAKDSAPATAPAEAPSPPRDGPRASTPSLRQGATTVSGKLPVEVIQRIIRQNFGRFRLCYEDGMRTNAALAGRVAAKFTIDGHGAVSRTSDGGSDLPDKEVVACVLRSIKNLSFPRPEGGGNVDVVYPIIMEPGTKSTGGISH